MTHRPLREYFKGDVKACCCTCFVFLFHFQAKVVHEEILVPLLSKIIFQQLFWAKNMRSNNTTHMEAKLVLFEHKHRNHLILGWSYFKSSKTNFPMGTFQSLHFVLILYVWTWWLRTCLFNGWVFRENYFKLQFWVKPKGSADWQNHEGNERRIVRRDFCLSTVFLKILLRMLLHSIAKIC